MNRITNYTTTISSSLYSSLVFLVISNYIQEQETKIKLKTQLNELMKDQIVATSINSSEVIVPGYFAKECRKKAADNYYKLYNSFPITELF